MRNLTKEQEELLRRYIDCSSIGELPEETITNLEEINNYKKLWHDVDRYLRDQYWRSICR